MIQRVTLVTSLLLGLVYSMNLTFPPMFRFGVASAAYQIEGGWNVKGKGVSIWDYYSHLVPAPMYNNSNGDVACDSYHKWERDVEIVAELGVQFYRFSLSWTRLLPFGLPTYISEDGKNYYNNLIDSLLARGIEPIVTMYHWDLPQRLQNLGGWANPLAADWFADYARVVFSLFADRIKTWITINEPVMICDEPYNSGNLAPSLINPDFTSYLCSKHILIAHAKAWRIYDTEYRARYHGKLALSNHLIWFVPESDQYVNLTNLAYDYNNGRFSHAIYSKEGGWPPALEKVIEENSQKQGYPRSRLPPFSQAEIDLVKGTYDYYGLNYYMARSVRKAKPGEVLGPWPVGDMPEINAKLVFDPDWDVLNSSILTPIYPKGLRKIMVMLKQMYGDIEILITENGISDTGHNLNDNYRVKYIRDNLEQVLFAIKDGVKVTGYTYWSLMDNLEWTHGYRLKFGLYQVDFDDPERSRIPRKSAYYYKSIIAHRSLNVTMEPEECCNLTAGRGGGCSWKPPYLYLYIMFIYILSP